MTNGTTKLKYSGVTSQAASTLATMTANVSQGTGSNSADHERRTANT